MVGALIELVANHGAPQNIWLNGDPQITFFKKVYRRHTPFATELISLQFGGSLNFGDSGKVLIRPHADLAYRMFFVCDIPRLAAVFLNTKSQDVINAIKLSIFSDTSFSQQIKSFIVND